MTASGASGAPGAANLVGVMFSTLAAEMADPERFRRGRTYVRQHAVGTIDVGPGTATAEVQGSRREPYVVHIGCRAVRRAAALAALGPDGTVLRAAALVPRPDDLRISCTCPDWGDPCKHAVAALLALGEQLARDTAQLAAWREATNPSPDDPRAPGTAGARGAADSRDDRDGPDAAPDPLDEFFARGYEPSPLAPLPLRPASRRAFDGSDPVAELVLPAIDSARAELAALFRER